MERMSWLAIMVILVGSISGCGGSSGDTSTADGGSGAASATGPTTPEECVKSFLQAVKQGQDAQASKLLTTLAQQKTAELDMVVAPPGSDTAEFVIGEIINDSENDARVASAWTDLDHEGNPHTDEITWVLKREKSQWRIAGMAAQVFPDQDPIYLDFENPEEMIRQQEQAEQQAMQRAKAQNLEARKPGDPFQQQQPAEQQPPQQQEPPLQRQ
jgi:hypothetical protein